MTLTIRTWIVAALVTLAGAASAAPASIGYRYTRFPGPDGRVIELSIWYPTAFFAAALEAK